MRPWLPTVVAIMGWTIAAATVIAVSVAILYVKDLMTLFWLGSIVNVVLSMLKAILAQTAQHGKALMADAVHGLGDTVAEIVSALAYVEATRPPDKEHPWGHGKIESVGALAVAGILLYTAATIAWDSVVALGQLASDTWRSRCLERQSAEKANAQETPAPAVHASASGLARWAAIGVTLASVVLKEALFSSSLAVGEQTDSRLAVATAWHHRSDSLAAAVALASQVGASLGHHHVDALGGGFVASMLAHSACGSLLESLDDLLDYNPASEHEFREAKTRCGRDALSGSIFAVPGVKNHTLRTRRMGPFCLADVTIVVDARISASAASMVAEAVHNRVISDFQPHVTDVQVHVDPAGSPQSHRLETHSELPTLPADSSTDGAAYSALPDPEEIEERVRAALLALSQKRPDLPTILEVTELQSYFYKDELEDPEVQAGGRDGAYIHVKVDLRLPVEGTTLRCAQQVAVAARAEVMAAMPGLVREVDVDLELDEHDELAAMEAVGRQSAPVCRQPGGVAPAAATAGECEARSATEVPRPPMREPVERVTGMPPQAGDRDRTLERVTLVWQRGPESRQASGRPPPQQQQIQSSSRFSWARTTYQSGAPLAWTRLRGWEKDRPSHGPSYEILPKGFRGLTTHRSAVV
eukprot:gnl/TRDRNA2_/TRDRNA2_147593_c0_seq2.p1 gnl/TRDRNA2_/TRDRNA2_147593_c0~~gnl/TRDRNA2_/TRDRNA2_147593_c0_seq2.p1  ORF type:complete len:643 (-),score=107.84 gnl/TRDRNA2_/TRDRNA2_147593_c0_seq2:93-2021(-)